MPRHFTHRKHGPSTIKCHDCGSHVERLGEHRAVCPNSRRNKSRLSSAVVIPTVVAPSAPIGLSFVMPLAGHVPAASTLVLAAQPAAAKPIAETRDVLFLLDVSASMEGAKLSSAKEALVSIVGQMDEADRIGLITFDSAAFHKLQMRPVGQVLRQGELGPLVGRIFAKGNTALYDAVVLGVGQIRDPNRKTTVVVLTDGEDNSSTHSLDDALAAVRAAGKNITLSIVHVDAAGNRSAAYEQLVGVAGGGQYTVIGETSIVAEVTLVFTTAYRAKPSMATATPIAPATAPTTAPTATTTLFEEIVGRPVGGTPAVDEVTKQDIKNLMMEAKKIGAKNMELVFKPVYENNNYLVPVRHRQSEEFSSAMRDWLRAEGFNVYNESVKRSYECWSCRTSDAYDSDNGCTRCPQISYENVWFVALQ